MASTPSSSREQFAKYREYLRERRNKSKSSPGDSSPHSKDRAKDAWRQGEQRSFLRLIWEFWKILAGQRAAIAFALLTLCIATVCKLVPPAATKMTIDYVLGDNPLPDWWQQLTWLPATNTQGDMLKLLAGIVIGVSIMSTLMHIWGRWFATKASKRLQMSFRRQAFSHAVRLPLERVFALKSGGVSSILREDAGGVADLVFSLIYNPWRAVIQFLGSLAILAWVDWRLLLGSLLLIPAVVLTHRTWIGRIRPLYRDVRKKREEVDSHATESFGGMRVVRAFSRERSEAARFIRGNHLMARQELYVWWWARAVEIVWDVLIPTASAGLLVYGGAQVLRGDLSLGDLMMFLFYLAMLLEPIAVLATSATQLQNGMAGFDRTLDLLADPLELHTQPGELHVDPANTAGRITFNQVSFKYPESSQLVLKEVSFDALPGQVIALVGPSGAGKTTLCNLVARFYDPTSGSIELDGVDLRKIRVESFRRHLGIVEQDVFLFDGTIAENIGYAVRHATDEEILAAAEAANAHEFIERLEFGYETLIGERGVKLSGGQRQRLAIARALLANPRILILDEATSNLDTQSERLIQQSLVTLMEGRTSFVIAHRLSTIAHADQILVVDNGRILESGTHDSLLAQSGRYEQMVRMQMGDAMWQNGRR